MPRRGGAAGASEAPGLPLPWRGWRGRESRREPPSASSRRVLREAGRVGGVGRSLGEACALDRQPLEWARVVSTCVSSESVRGGVFWSWLCLLSRPYSPTFLRPQFLFSGVILQVSALSVSQTCSFCTGFCAEQWQGLHPLLIHLSRRLSSRWPGLTSADSLHTSLWPKPCVSKHV